MKRFVFAAFLVPLDASSWKALSYQNIPSHRISFGERMEVSVEASAGPLVHRFAAPKRITRVKVSAQFRGALDTTEPLGSSGADDFPLRLGLIRSGSKRLSFLQRLAAPDWVKELYKLAPKDGGIDAISFLNFLPEGKTASFQVRHHPKSELLEERIVGAFVNGTLSSSTPIEGAADVVGLWISVDGDDTKSRFTTTITAIELEVTVP
jgi:hypothetical protein